MDRGNLVEWDMGRSIACCSALVRSQHRVPFQDCECVHPLYGVDNRLVDVYRVNDMARLSKYARYVDIEGQHT